MNKDYAHELIAKAAYGCALGATLLVLSTSFSSPKFGEDSWFMSAMSIFAMLLPLICAPAYVMFFSEKRYVSEHMFLMLAIPLVPLLLVTWGSWAYMMEFVYLFVLVVASGVMSAYNRSKMPAHLRARLSGQYDERAGDGAQHPAPAPHASQQQALNHQDDGHDQHQNDGIVYRKEMVDVNFYSISGMNPVKDKLYQAALEIFRPPQNGRPARNGVLMYGLPGNGKTFFAEALAGQLKVGLIKVSFGDVVSRWIGQTTEQVVQVFRDAVRQAPCVLFIDEIDSLIKDRNNNPNASEESARTTNAILTEIVNLRKHRVMLIAATNLIDTLDPAAIREGRFDFKIEITPPDAVARKELIRRAVESFGSITVDPKSLNQAVKRWEGFSVARIKAVGEEVGRYAEKKGISVVNYRMLQAALRATQGRSGRLPADTPLLDDLVMPAALSETLNGVAFRMKNIEETERLGGQIPGGMLFLGPPGTGKTITARALAKTTGWAFLDTSGNELLADPSKIDALVQQARDIRPCIVFLDEADDVLADRSMSPHTASITNRLLTAVDGAGGKVHDVVWIAATNHPERMDAAAKRGGRFTVKVEFMPPDMGTLQIFIEKWKKDCPARFSNGANAENIAGMLLGASIANVKAVLQQAVNIAVDRKLIKGGAEKVTVDDVRVAASIILEEN
jgi:transitional endoplasmic reticulum ATPase